MTVRSPRAEAILDELPVGAVALGRHYLEAADRALVSTLTVECSAAAVESHLVRPVELVDDWPDPTDPLPVGNGAVHADLIDDDRELFGALRAALAADGGGSLSPERLAVEAQVCRLPVTPYRRRRNRRLGAVASPSSRSAAVPADSAAPAGWTPPGRSERSAMSAVDSGPVRDPATLRVVDLTALWAGPLATSLLASVGAQVIKIDPSCRPDAFGEHPELYRHLNEGKEILDLDLRRDDGRRRFEALVTTADLVVDSFSRRVMPNLGYGPAELRRLRPSLATMSIVAFAPHGPCADWVAYGPGVHAMSGLAETTPDEGGRPAFRAAPIAYPDALAGLQAFAVALDLLGTTAATPHCTIALSSAIEPLLSHLDGTGTDGGEADDDG